MSALDPVLGLMWAQLQVRQMADDPTSSMHGRLAELPDDQRDSLIRDVALSLFRARTEDGSIAPLPDGATPEELAWYLDDICEASLDPKKMRAVSMLMVLAGTDDMDDLVDAGVIERDPTAFTRAGVLPNPTVEGFRQARAICICAAPRVIRAAPGSGGPLCRARGWIGGDA